jgi:hypothetical protein
MNYYGENGGVLTKDIMPIIIDRMKLPFKSNIYAIYGNITKGAIDLNSNEMFFLIGKRRLVKLPRYLAHEFAHSHGANQEEAIEFADELVNKNNGDWNFFFNLLRDTGKYNALLKIYINADIASLENEQIGGYYSECCRLIDTDSLSPIKWMFSRDGETREIITNNTITLETIVNIKFLSQNNPYLTCNVINEKESKHHEMCDIQNDAIIKGIVVNEKYYHVNKGNITKILSQIIDAPEIKTTTRTRNRNIIRACCQMIQKSEKPISHFAVDYEYEIRRDKNE